MWSAREALRRALDLRDGEEALVFRAGSVLFGLIAGHTLLETARDAVFLGKLPPSRLGLVYALLAVLSLGIARITGRVMQRFGHRNLFVFSLMAASFGTVFLYLLPESGVTAFVLYLWSALLGSVLTIEFWALVGGLLSTAQAKRLLGPLAAGGVVGAVAGATLAALLVMSLPVSVLLPIASAVFLGTSVAALGFDVDAGEANAPPRRADRAARDPRTEAYLKRLGVLVAAITAAVLVGDYLFKASAARDLGPDRLPSFLARYYAVLNLASLAVQLFLSSRAVRRAGVVNAASVLPVALFGSGVAVFFTGGALSAAAIVRGADGAMRHSLHRVTQELLWMPVSEPRRSHAKSVFDALLGRGVQAVTSLLLFGLATQDLDRGPLLGAIVAALAAVAMAAAMSLRARYLELFRAMLTRAPAGAEADPIELDLDSAELVMEALSSRDEPRVVAALELLHTKGRGGLIPSLILYHESPAVLARALAVLPTLRRRDWIPLAERLLDHAAPEVRAHAVRALTLVGATAPIQQRLNDVSPTVRAQATFAICDAEQIAQPESDPRVAALLAAKGDAGRSARIALVEAIVAQGDRRWLAVAFSIADEGDRELTSVLAELARRFPDPAWIDKLVPRLSGGDGRRELRRALVAHGEPALEAIAAVLRDPRAPAALRLHVPRSLSAFRSQRAADLLVDVLTTDGSGAVRYKALRALGRFVEEDAKVRVDAARIVVELRRNLVEHFRLRTLSLPLEQQKDLGGSAVMVRDLTLEYLADKARQARERAFRLIKLLHRGEDVRRGYDALVGGDRRARAAAVEYFDALTAEYVRRGEVWSDVRELFRVLLDELPLADEVERAAPFVRLGPMDLRAALRTLTQDGDDAVVSLSACLAQLVGVSLAIDDQVIFARAARLVPQAAG